MSNKTTEDDDDTATHAYAQFGVYTVTFTVSDDDGGVGQTAVTVIVGCGVQALRLEPSTSMLGQARAGKALYAVAPPKTVWSRSCAPR